MINRKEITDILIISIILTFSMTLFHKFSNFLEILIYFLIIILINVFVKKIVSYYFESEVETKIWSFKRWGYKPNNHFRKEFLAGAFFPIISSILFLPLNGFIWMSSLIFDVKSKIYRAAKRHGLYSFTEISGDHIAYIAAAGIFANLLFSFIAYLIGFSEFAKLSIWFTFFNIIPISNLDGNKIFFGSKVLWSLLATIILIAMGYTFLVI